MRTSTTLLLAALAALPGCACQSVPAGAVIDCNAEVVPDTVATDILFVIDDSGSMSQEQDNLRANLGAFIDALAASPVQNEFRIGVTSTSVEEFTVRGTTRRSYANGTPSAGVPFPAGALVAIAQDGAGAGQAGRLVYDPVAYAATGGWGGARLLDKGDGSAAALAALTRDFKANVLQGIDGSGKEQPFRAARLALTDRLLDANAGFLRPGARLAVIIVTDEDDCSDTASPERMLTNDACHLRANKDATPPVMDTVADMAAFLSGPIDGELRDAAVGIIGGFSPAVPGAGDLVPDLCTTTVGGVLVGQAFDRGDRLAALATTLGADRARLGSICDPDFSATLRAFGEILMPSTLPLKNAPADWRPLVVAGTPEAPAAAAVYSPPGFGQPARILFQNGCRLGLGDKIELHIVCAN